MKFFPFSVEMEINPRASVLITWVTSIPQFTNVSTLWHITCEKIHNSKKPSNLSLANIFLQTVRASSHVHRIHPLFHHQTSMTIFIILQVLETAALNYQTRTTVSNINQYNDSHVRLNANDIFPPYFQNHLCHVWINFSITTYRRRK